MTVVGRLLQRERHSGAQALEILGAEVVGDTIGGEPCVFLRGLHIAERAVAERLLGLLRGSPPWPAIDVEKAVPWVEKRTGKALAPSQSAAIETALQSKVAVITGGPGVSKARRRRSALIGLGPCAAWHYRLLNFLV
ncbi:hypothetical protein [Methylosinus sp. Ce-a6]|uniref:hypothetical protein n=1 Tax=Methylosinus sp. Ce-a6 TaxID=2172005 RepID=UPI0019169375|nr:hypothetical protein [Methylosinus sp. Ce-a6]